MRTGPKPLPFQLGMASMASAGLAGGTQFSGVMLQDFFKGIQKYQAHPFKRDMPPLPIVWQEGTARLYHAAPPARLHAAPIVLIPSMVNKADILDLLPDRSLLRFLAAQGFDAYLFDWGDAAEDAGQADMDGAVLKRLIPAIEAIGKPACLLGYCMGGLMTAAVCALRPDLVRAALFLAMPWNFHDERAALKARMTLMKPMAVPYMTQYNRLPESWMQAVFATLDPEGSIRKFASFATMAEDDRRAEIFIAVEDWLNDGVDLPAAIATTCMEDWYEDNASFKGGWHVGGMPVRAGDIRVPTFVIAAKEDRIVPPESAMAFAAQRVKGDSLLCAGGHVGLMSGKRAVENVWHPAAAWFAAQQ